MANNKSVAQSKGPSEQEKPGTVELWQSHPRQQPGTPYWPMGTPDRRRAENAKLRHWMTLGDQALGSEDQIAESDEAPTSLPDENSGVDGPQ